ncbi:MAG: hypothetical protein JW863_16240 [Chitinispirillaceae bacterium]|nr:hypothetical protein [Chitinispirillaceae bacterium]
MKMNTLPAIVITALVITVAGFGEEGGVKLTPSGFGSYEVGQIVEANPISTGDVMNIKADHLLVQKVFIGLNLHLSYEPLPISTNIGLEMKSFTVSPRSKLISMDQGQATRFFYFTYLTRADFVYSHSDAFNLEVGFFPVKYNENARNLGEYLFRTGTYPQYIITNFDFAAARVTGLNAFGTLLGNLNYQTLLTINTEYATMGDLNLTGITSYSFLDRFCELGAGVSFCSIISADARHTHPPLKDVTQSDRYKYLDGIDTNTYTFAGTKLMGRILIDPKSLFQIDIFGKDDLKLYAEAAVLGVKNYPTSINYESTIIINADNDTFNIGTRYDDIMKRLPIMFGINVPTFKLLDVLNFEAQWFGSIYPNDMAEYIRDGIPVPICRGPWEAWGYADSTRDNWKWSFYAKKTLANHFNVVLQVASDHLRWDYSADYGKQSGLLSEALTRPNHMYWVVKMGYNF